MKLKRLDIHGFKSFYHRTTVVFDAGITAVVGPNGCGKSNIVDAIKWVMGEQGAKNLRGEAMEDVLFAGSERRGPMGICEVRLTFENDGTGDIPARWREVSELAIERSLERSKGSDYRINKQRCRLADVQELIAGTGVGSGPGGRRAYAIIEQGQIGRIVSAKADERRLLIEEAAGITRFRARKRIAERKMAETELNLERVDDVIGEVEAQLRTLRRQAKKAERFKAYRDEAREIAQRVVAAEFAAASARASEARTSQTEKTRSAADAGVQVEVTEAALAAAELAEKAASSSAQSARETLARAEGEVKVAKADREALEREAKGLQTQIEGVRGEMALAASRHGELRRERDTAASALNEMDSGDSEAEAVAASEVESKSAERAQSDARTAVEKLRREDAEEAARVARARAELGQAERAVEGAERRHAAANAQVEAVKSSLLAAESRVAAAEAAADTAESAVTSAFEARKHAQAQRLAAESAADAAGQAERKAREAVVAVRSRLESLEALEKQREGLGDGVRSLLGEALDGVVGPVIEAVGAPEDLESALAAGLGARLSGVLVDDRAAALRARDRLTALGGRAWLSYAEDAEPEPAPSGEGVVGRLDTLVEAPALTAVLAQVLVVEDAATAARVDWAGPIVTRDGTRFEAGGVEGGAPSADLTSLSRGREIRTLRGDLESKRAEQAAADRARNEALAARTAARKAVDDAGRAAHAAELARTGRRKDRDRALGERRSAQARHDEVVAQAEAGAAEVEAARANKQSAAEALVTAEAAGTDRNAALEVALGIQRQAEAKREAAVGRVHEARTALIARQERLRAAQSLVDRLERQLAEVDARKARDERSRVEAERGLSALSDRRILADRRLIDFEERALKAATAAGETAAVRDEADAKTQDARVAAHAARAAHNEVREALNAANLELQAADLRLEHVASMVAERFHTTPAELLAVAEGQPVPTADDRDRLTQLEALIERMGDVNVNAIEEYATVETRFGFLTTQKQDLLDALVDLRSAIDQINRTTRKLFRETFEAVNGHFEELFPRLFRGGTAGLSLTDPNDMLNTGIDMLVEPPGKKVQNVSLLSGGEKAMCALALVFAVFRVRPSPFCLLDEVDAPLDDANIGRFNEVVREIARESQVLLITHNKRTMEIADVLYGITMEESGVSKLVSVRMG